MPINSRIGNILLSIHNENELSEIIFIRQIPQKHNIKETKHKRVQTIMLLLI